MEIYRVSPVSWRFKKWKLKSIYWVFIGFTEFSRLFVQRFTGFSWFFTGFYWSWIERSKCLPNFTRFYWVLLGLVVLSLVSTVLLVH